MREFDYYSPRTIEELVDLLQKTNGRIIAGGTDIIPQMRSNQITSSVLIDISGINY